MASGIIGRPPKEDVDIDLRLGAKTRYGSAADVMDLGDQARQQLLQPRMDLFEQDWPSWIVFYDLDRSASARFHASGPSLWFDSRTFAFE